MTHTFALLEISPAAHAEIAQLLRAAGYDHAIDHDQIDMMGVALIPAANAVMQQVEYPPLPKAYATAHDDGHWTMPRGCEPHESHYAGWKESVYSEAQMRAYVDADRKARQLSACNFCLSEAAEARAALQGVKPQGGAE